MNDVISRNAAITTAKNAYTACGDRSKEDYRDMLIACLEELPSAQLEQRTDKRTETHACDLISRQWLMECVEEGWIKFETEKDENKFIHLVRDTAPPAQPELIEKAAYIRGFEQGRTQGMIDAQGGKKMNKQRKVVITTTYNEMGIIIDTKAEELDSSAQPERTEYFPDTKAIPSQSDYVCLSEKVTATFFDAEHEEWTQQTVTIADVLDSVCDDYTVLPSAQPETANIIVGKSRDGMTMWYQCDNCNEPVDENDLYCRGCGRRFEHGSD